MCKFTIHSFMSSNNDAYTIYISSTQLPRMLKVLLVGQEMEVYK